MCWKIGKNAFKQTYFVFIGTGVWHLFLIPHLYILQVPTKHTREKILDPRKYPQEKTWTHEIPTKKSFRPTKYPWEKPLDPRNTHEKNYGPTKARWHDGTKPTRPTMAREPQNLARSIKHKMRNIFLEKAYTKCGGETLPRPFKKSKLSIFLNQ